MSDRMRNQNANSLTGRRTLPEIHREVEPVESSLHLFSFILSSVSCDINKPGHITSPKIPRLCLLSKAIRVVTLTKQSFASSHACAARIRAFNSSRILNMAAPAVAANAETLDLKKVKFDRPLVASFLTESPVFPDWQARCPDRNRKEGPAILARP